MKAQYRAGKGNEIYLTEREEEIAEKGGTPSPILFFFAGVSYA